MKYHVGLKGFYHLTLTSETTGETREFEFENLILDSGLDMYGEGLGINSCALGADTIEPVTNQATMNNILGTTSTLQASGVGESSLTTAPFYCSYFWQYRFVAGVATGNISQVGMGYQLTSTNASSRRLFSLALIKDADGNPITITKKADEVLDIRYTRRLYIPDQDVAGKIKIGEVEYDTLVRVGSLGAWRADVNLSISPSWTNTYRGEIGTINQLPALNISSSATINTDSYQLGSFKRTFRYNWDLNQANHADGIRCIAFPISSNYNYFQVRYSKVADGSTIPKTGDNVLSLNYEISWGRANVT